MSPLYPVSWRISWMRFQFLVGIPRALRADAGWTSITWIFLSFSFFVILIAHRVRVFMAQKRGGNTGYPSLCICLSASRIAFFFGKARGASIATSVGEQLKVWAKISLVAYRWQVWICLFLSRAHPVGLVAFPARSIPTMTFFCNFGLLSLCDFIDASLWIRFLTI